MSRGGPNQNDAIGLIAGWGSFPVEVARHLRSAGRDLIVVGLKGHADQQLESIASEFHWYDVLKIGAHIRFFQKAGVRQIVFAGKIFKDRILYQGRGWIEHLPDATCIRVLGGSFITGRRDGRDDTVLSAIVAEYERKHMKILPITTVAPKLLAECGCLTRHKPSRKGLRDIQFGWPIARRMGDLDIGQSITVRDQVVLAVEAIEGTDGLIARTGKICSRGGFVLIKIAKPKQDMRYDVPTIGLGTVEQMIRAGGKTIAIEEGRTILVEREATLHLADRHGISIVSLSERIASTVDQQVLQPESPTYAPASHSSCPRDAA